MDLKELKKKAQTNPEALSKAEWAEVCKEAFGVPKKVYDESPSPKMKVRKTEKRENWWG